MKLAIAPIVQWLDAQGVSPVDGIVEFARTTTAPARLPWHFVVPLGEAAQPNRFAGAARDQRVEVRFAVLTVMNGAQRRSDGVNDDLKRLTDRIRVALSGWVHPEASGPTDYAGAELHSTDDGMVIWIQRFTAHYHERTIA